jgi:hypothetical protein
VDLPATVHRLLTERKHIVVLGAAVVALALPAAAFGAQHKDGKLPARVRLRAEAPASTSAIGNAVAVDGPLLDPVDRYSRLIAVTTQRTEHRQKVQAHKKRVVKEAREEEERFAALPGGVSIETLEAIAACESGGDPEAVSADGTYRGLFQFDQGTWESVGGSGDPAAAPAEEQQYRAALLYSAAGSSPWPVCGQ